MSYSVDGVRCVVQQVGMIRFFLCAMSGMQKSYRGPASLTKASRFNARLVAASLPSPGSGHGSRQLGSAARDNGQCRRRLSASPWRHRLILPTAPKRSSGFFGSPYMLL